MFLNNETQATTGRVGRQLADRFWARSEIAFAFIFVERQRTNLPATLKATIIIRRGPVYSYHMDHQKVDIPLQDVPVFPLGFLPAPGKYSRTFIPFIRMGECRFRGLGGTVAASSIQRHTHPIPQRVSQSPQLGEHS